MENHNTRIKNYLLQLDFNITYENEEDGILMISKESEGIKNLILGIAPPILIMEQYIFKINNFVIGISKIYSWLIQFRF